ncbi:hypothetical protein BB560_000807 [Smittium megazygosporum]|uniref:Uncharacterized protein n=1 Tax=Smittium megazygosporum TaxID=133381 RepID=A0A2T9ZJC3_9FUNG|nr:hypothetical protein BB560_000807 [Smittium megazygosporum]
MYEMLKSQDAPLTEEAFASLLLGISSLQPEEALRYAESVLKDMNDCPETTPCLRTSLRSLSWIKIFMNTFNFLHKSDSTNYKEYRYNITYILELLRVHDCAFSSKGLVNLVKKFELYPIDAKHSNISTIFSESRNKYLPEILILRALTLVIDQYKQLSKFNELILAELLSLSLKAFEPVNFKEVVNYLISFVDNPRVKLSVLLLSFNSSVESKEFLLSNEQRNLSTDLAILTLNELKSIEKDLNVHFFNFINSEIYNPSQNSNNSKVQLSTRSWRNFLQYCIANDQISTFVDILYTAAKLDIFDLSFIDLNPLFGDYSLNKIEKLISLEKNELAYKDRDIDMLEKIRLILSTILNSIKGKFSCIAYSPSVFSIYNAETSLTSHVLRITSFFLYFDCARFADFVYETIKLFVLEERKMVQDCRFTENCRCALNYLPFVISKAAAVFENNGVTWYSSKLYELIFLYAENKSIPSNYLLVLQNRPEWEYRSLDLLKITLKFYKNNSNPNIDYLGIIDNISVGIITRLAICQYPIQTSTKVIRFYWANKISISPAVTEAFVKAIVSLPLSMERNDVYTYRYDNFYNGLYYKWVPKFLFRAIEDGFIIPKKYYPDLLLYFGSLFSAKNPKAVDWLLQIMPNEEVNTFEMISSILFAGINHRKIYLINSALKLYRGGFISSRADFDTDGIYFPRLNIAVEGIFNGIIRRANYSYFKPDLQSEQISESRFIHQLLYTTTEFLHDYYLSVSNAIAKPSFQVIRPFIFGLSRLGKFLKSTKQLNLPGHQEIHSKSQEFLGLLINDLANTDEMLDNLKLDVILKSLNNNGYYKQAIEIFSNTKRKIQSLDNFNKEGYSRFQSKSHLYFLDLQESLASIANLLNSVSNPEKISKYVEISVPKNLLSSLNIMNPGIKEYNNAIFAYLNIGCLHEASDLLYEAKVIENLSLTDSTFAIFENYFNELASQDTKVLGDLLAWLSKCKAYFQMV